MPFTMRSISTALILCLTAVLLMMLPQMAAASSVDDSLTIGIQSTKTPLIRPLDPQERDILSVYNVVYESLITIDDDYLPAPCLAESWECSSNGKVWTFHLRTDVSFSDGTPMTAHDVVATAQEILNRANDENSSNPGYYANLKYFVSSVNATDDYTVVFHTHTNRTYMGILYELTFPVLKATEVSIDNPHGTGPYQVSAFAAGSYLYLDVNPHWWQMQPQVKTINCIMYETPSAVIQAYQYAQVDCIFTRSIAAAQYKSGTNSLAIAYRSNQLEVLLMNHSSSKLASTNVRKAIRYVVDPDKIASTIYMGMVSRTDFPMIPGTWMYNNNLDHYFVRDIERAKQLLAAEGWGDSNEDGYLDRLDEKGELERLSLNLYVYEEPDNNVRLETANLIKTELSEVGIAVNITTMSMNEVQTKLSAGAFNLVLCSYAMDPCPDPGFLLIGGNSGNYMRYRSSRVTDLCKELRKCTSQTKYQQLLHQIQENFAEDCPFICLFFRSGSVLSRKMYTTIRDVRELYLLKGIESFRTR